MKNALEAFMLAIKCNHKHKSAMHINFADTLAR